MKRLLIFLTTTLLAIVANADTWDGVSSDKSWYNENSTEFFINNAAQLKGLADLVNNDSIFFDGKTVYLQSDIDLANKNWVPIGFGYKISFNGSFDGQNHIVNNMYCPTNQFEHGAITRFGLFGESSGSISNLEIQGTISINGGYLSSPCIGGVVGYGNDITNVRSNIIINTWASLGLSYIGNVAGWAHNMSKIYSTGEVHFYDYARFSDQSHYGGIVGHGWELSECFSNVRVVIPSDGSPMFSGGSVGGIAGEASSISDATFTGRFEVYENNKNRTTLSGCISGQTGHLTNIVCAPSYYYCNTEKNVFFKGLVVPGINQPTVNNVYYQNTYAQGTSVIGTGVSEEFLKSGVPLEGFDTNIWEFKKNEYPSLIALREKSYYTLSYYIDDVVYKEYQIREGTAITPEPKPEGNYISFEWEGQPETMPAHDVTVVAFYEKGIPDLDISVWDGGSSDTGWYDESLSEYHLTSAAQLKGLADLVNINNCTFEGKTIILNKDIDLCNYKWEPIGLNGTFMGSFEGNNKRIINLHFASNGDNYFGAGVGLFGSANKARFANLGIQGEIEFYRACAAGGLAGYALNSTISNITCKVDIKSAGSEYVLYGGQIGLVIGSGRGTRMSKIYGEGKITIVSPSVSHGYYGGIAGLVTSISESHSEAQINILHSSGGSGSLYVGGIAGEAYSTVDNSRFTGSITVNNDGGNHCLTRGICVSDGEIRNVISAPSYFYSYVNPSQSALIDLNSHITNSYYTTTYASSSEGGTSITENNLKSGEPLDGFDTSVWKFKSGKYPSLRIFYHKPRTIYAITYYIDGVEYQKDRYYEGHAVTLPEEPTKEGYVFNGWSEIPETMPDHDVTVTGTFRISDEIVTGKCGDNLTWTFEKSTKTLTISGTGEMWNYDYDISDGPLSPWINLRQDIKTVLLEDGITSIGTAAFNGCSNMETINIPNSIITIGSCAFWECSSLKSISIPSAVSTIWGGVFAGCKSLTNVNIPNGVTTIDEYAFWECSSLQSILLPQSLATIVNDAFAGCNNLVTVTAKMETPLSITKETFSNRSNATLYVLKRCKEKYASSAYWNEFKEIKTIKHMLAYNVDSELYKEYDVDEGEAITPEPDPTKEGYTFSGWSEIPKTMPDYDVVVTGNFTINKYMLTYVIDGVKYKSYEIEYGEAITPEDEPTKEGCTFSGWSWIPRKMPAEDVTVSGSFIPNKYKVTYMVDGEVYQSYEVLYGSTINPEAEPKKEGYTFSGWSYIPSKMPAEDVTVSGRFTINSYKLTYMIDDQVYKEIMVEYGAAIKPEPQPEGDYAHFEWVGLPEKMPANNVTVYASYETGIIEALALQSVRAIYAPNGKKLDKPQKGLNIIIMSDGKVRKVVIK